MFTISEDLWLRIRKERITVQLHSRFQSAINLKSEKGMITILSAHKCLQPSSVLADESIDLRLLSFPKTGIELSEAGVYGCGCWIIPFHEIQVKHLKLENPTPLPLLCSQIIRAFLIKEENKGIHCLIEDRADNVYAEFLRPRIREFRISVRQNDLERVKTSVGRLAGCGPGLTPSSDDFLCGYICALPQTAHNLELSKVVIESACKKTNDISAALLQHAREQLYSADILMLISAFRSGSSVEIKKALKFVAEFGNSSGCDFLTGMYFGILDSYKKEG